MARPREFDKTEVLSKAMDYFWKYGYEGASMQELVNHVGIKAQSLYNTYGSKRDLYFTALKHYVNQSTVVHTLEHTTSGKEAITQVFRELLEYLAGSDRTRGCFLNNTCVELAPHDSEIADFIEKERIRLERAYYHALTRAKEQGEINERYKDLMALARYLNNAQGGLMVTAKTVTDMTVLEDIVRITLSIFD